MRPPKPPWNHRMIVDLCAHVWDNPEQLGPWAAQRLREEEAEPWLRPHPTPQALGQAMQVVDRVLVHGFTSRLLGAEVPLERLATFIEVCPDKCLGVVGLDPMAPDWQPRLRDALVAGMVGVSISPAAQGFHPCHSEAMALYERCEGEGLLLYIQPRVNMAPQAVMSFADPAHLDEVARTFPGLKMVIGGLGRPWLDPTLALVQKHENVWTDLAGLVEKPWPLYQALVHAAQHRALDRILLASGFPFCQPQEAISNLYSINNFSLGTQLPTVPRQQLRGIVERDALARLGLGPASTSAGDNGAPESPTRSADATDAAADERDRTHPPPSPQPARSPLPPVREPADAP